MGWWPDIGRSGIGTNSSFLLDLRCFFLNSCNAYSCDDNSLGIICLRIALEVEDLVISYLSTKLASRLSL